MKLGNDDYRGMDPAAALADFLSRVAKYESVYEPVDEDELSYIKLYNVGQKVCAVCRLYERVVSLCSCACLCVPHRRQLARECRVS